MASTPVLTNCRFAKLSLIYGLLSYRNGLGCCPCHKIYSLFFFGSVQLLLKGASERGAKKIRVHILTDGRDVLDGSSVGFVETLENDLSQLREKGIDAQIASGGGRMYVTMDRYEVNTSHLIQPSIFIVHFALQFFF